MPPRGARVAKQVQATATTRRSTRNKTLALRLQKEQEKEQEKEQQTEHKDETELLGTRDEADEDDQRRLEEDRLEERRLDAIANLSNVPLSTEQQLLRDRVLQFCRDNLRAFGQEKKPKQKQREPQRPSVFVIQGDAGTGKSVVLNALFNELQRQARATEGDETHKKDENDKDILAGTQNYLVVNHPEMLKLYHRISAQFPYIRKTDLERPTSLINRLQKEQHRPRGLSSSPSSPAPFSSGIADVVLVDEAHLLLSRKNAYKRFFGDNQLDELLKLAKVVVLVFDGKQSLRFDAHWNEDKLAGFLDDGDKVAALARHQLAQQFRVTAAPDMQSWIEALSVERRVLPRPRTDADRRATGDASAFDFRIYDDAGALYAELMQRNAEHGGVGARLLSTYDFPYRLPKSGERNQKLWYVECGTFRIPWDKYLPQIPEPWAEQPDSHKYCGSVYTIQGFDLLYAGVILGPSVGYDADKDALAIRTDRYEDHAAFMGRKNDPTATVDKERIVLNSINVLLTRGVRGLYLYAHDPELRKRLLAC